jgi:hypothetical protein
MKSIIIKSLTICALMALSFTTFAQGNHYYSGSTLSDPYGRCQIYFPGEPTYTYQDIDTDMGKVRMYQFMFQTTDAVYMLAYVDYPADKMVGRDIDAMLTKAANGFIDALKLTSRSQSFINYGSYKGIMFLADNAENYTSMRDFIVNNRLYQLGIFKVGSISSQTENEYFDSFVLTK